MNHLKFVEGSDCLIEGWAAPFSGPFNGRDIDGETFKSSTDFCLDWFPVRPLIYEHGLNPETETAVIGQVKSWEVRDEGLWVQAELNKASQYFSAVKQIIDKSAASFSSGAMAHLVRKSTTGVIERWPWCELSVTPRPCNPYATLDFATAEKHFKSAGLDTESFKAKLDAAARDSLSDSDYAYIDSAGNRHLPINDAAHVRDALSRFDQTEFESDAAKEKAHAKIVARAKELGVDVSDDAKKSASIKSMEGSYEDLLEDLSGLLNPQTPFGPKCYSCLVATYADYVIVCRHDYGEEDETYWKVAYTTGDDGEPVLGKATQVEQTYVPAKSFSSESPLTLDAQSLSRHATALVTRTEGLHERRVAEGRVLSVANRVQIASAVKALGTASQTLQTLLDTTAQVEQDQAKAKALASPDGLQRRLNALHLFVENLPE